VTVTTIAPQTTRSGVGSWAAAGFALYVVLGVVSLLVVARAGDMLAEPFGIDIGAGTVGLSIRNGVHHVAWGLTVVLVAAPLGRRLVPSIRFERQSVPVLLSGLALAGMSEFLLNEWARERFTYFDPEYVGLAGFAPAATVAIAVASWAAMSVPRASRSVLLALVVLSVVGLTVAVLPSVPGLGDGLDPSSVPLAVALVADGAFAVFALAIARR
jgi:hypothetical protein